MSLPFDLSTAEPLLQLATEKFPDRNEFSNSIYEMTGAIRLFNELSDTCRFTPFLALYALTRCYGEVLDAMLMSHNLYCPASFVIQRDHILQLAAQFKICMLPILSTPERKELFMKEAGLIPTATKQSEACERP